MTEGVKEIEEVPKVQVPVAVVRKKLLEAVMVEVSKELYRTIRSFVESSSKSKYSWNTGINYTNSLVKFVKPGKWELTVDLLPEIRGDIYDCPVWLRSLIGTGREGVTVCFRKEEDPVYHTPTVNMYINVAGDFVRFESVEDLELHRYVIYNKEVMFVRPITLYEIIKAINDYVDIEEYRATLEKALEQTPAEQQAKTA